MTSKEKLCWVFGLIVVFIGALAIGMLWGMKVPPVDYSDLPKEIKFVEVEVPTTVYVQQPVYIEVEKNVTKVLRTEFTRFCPFLGRYDCEVGGSGSRAFVEKSCTDGTVIKYNCSNREIYEGPWPKVKDNVQ